MGSDLKKLKVGGGEGAGSQTFKTFSYPVQNEGGTWAMKEEGEKRFFSFFTFPFLVLVSRTNIPFFPISSKKANGILG